MSLKVQLNKYDASDVLQPGDTIQMKKTFYSHWAVYIGDNQIIHVIGEEGRIQSNPQHVFTISGQRFSKAKVVMSDLWDEARDFKAVYKNIKLDEKYQPLSPSEIVENAKKLVGKQYEYNLLFNNCEQFANLLRYGKHVSLQARDVAKAAGVGGVGGVALTIAVVVAALLRVALRDS